MTNKPRTAQRLGASIAALTALAACGSVSGSGDGTGDPPAATVLTVLASFYPLEYVTGRIAGDRAQVQNLTAPGAEAHDLELTPRDVAAVSEADLVVYLGGFQPAVDEAVAQEATDQGLDVAPAADLNLTATEEEHEEGDDHSEEEEEHGGPDPHFWLDPTRLAEVSATIAERLSDADPAGASSYRSNLKSVQTDLTALDAELQQGLATCASTDLVTAHQAFGYLAQRYSLRQVGITGLSPEEEPTAADLARVTEFVRANDVKTIYYETLVDPAVAETVARETGAATAVLDPLEGLSDTSPGSDYLAVMRANLAAMQKGQPCP